MDTSVNSLEPGKEQPTETTREKSLEHPSPVPDAPLQIVDPKDLVDAERTGVSSNPEARNMSTLKWISILLSVYIPALLYGLDTTIVADIQGTIIEDFGEPEKLTWVGVGFSLGSIVVVLSLGKAYGIFNIKWLFFSSFELFEAGSALCGGSPNMTALIVGRVIAGVGGAGIYLGGLNILTTLTTLYKRPRYMALSAVFWGLGTILGPVIEGAFSSSKATWRWSFYINLVIFAVIAPIFLFVVPSLNPQPQRKFLEKLAQMDWVGTALNAGIYISWVIALTLGGVQWAWSDGRTIACFVVCGALIIFFGLQQYFNIFTSVKQRIFPVGFLFSRYLLLQYLGTSCVAASRLVPIYYIPIFFQFTRGDGALEAAVRILPFIIVAMYLASGIFILIGGALMMTVGADTSPAKVYRYSVLIAIGTGLSSPASYSVSSAKVATDSRYGRHMIPDVIGFINMSQIGSVVHALAISNTIFQNLTFQYLSQALAGMGFTDDQLHSAISGTQSDFLDSASDAVKDLIVAAIIKAASRVYILVVVAGAVCLAPSLPMKMEKLFVKAPARSA